MILANLSYIPLVQAILNGPKEYSKHWFNETCIRECGDDVPFTMLIQEDDCPTNAEKFRTIFTMTKHFKRFRKWEFVRSRFFCDTNEV